MAMTAPFARPQQEERGTITPGSLAFVEMWERASERERALLGEMHQFYEREARRLVANGEQPAGIAAGLFRIIDASVAQTLATPNGKKVQCRKGCAACCSLHVTITRAEAELLLMHIEQEAIPVDWALVARQAERGLGEWRAQPPAERRCALLDERGACRAYESRPAACRKYMVMSAPKLCDTERYPGGEVAILVAIEGEVVASAALSVMESGSMARMLQQARERANDVLDV